MTTWYQDVGVATHLLLPSDWEECFSHALRRVSVAINHRHIAREMLRLEDSNLRARVGHLDRHLFNERLQVPKDLAHLDEDMVKGEFARWFYGQLSLSQTGKFLRVESVITWAFLKGTYQSLRYPADYSAAILGFEGVRRFQSPRAQMAAMGVNYLVKNLWHNYVHIKLQGITHNNFHAFKGRARYQSDFEADNWATLLLVRSYGLPVVASSLQDTDNSNENIVRLLRRNRCNDVFLERSGIVGEELSPDEIEWEYCRRIAVYLSGWLVAHGRAASTLSVYLTDRGRRRFVAAEVNGAYLSTDISADPKQRSTRERRQQVARDIDEKYLELLRNDRRRRNLAAESLKTKFAQLGVD